MAVNSRREKKMMQATEVLGNVSELFVKKALAATWRQRDLGHGVVRGDYPARQ